MSYATVTEPRDPLEDLGRLGARGPALGGGGRGGPVRWTALDIAAALSGYAHGDQLRLRDAQGPTLLALVKYAFDRGSVYPLAVVWWVKVVDVAVRGGWHAELRGPDGVRARVLADAVLEEFLCGDHCRTCHGAAVQHNQAPCPACDGLGRFVRGEWWWASTLQRRRSAVAPWMPRIRALFGVLQDWEAEARASLAAGRREGEIVPVDPGQ